MKELYGKRALSARQSECLRLVAAGETNSAIAKRMRITVHGVKDHLRELYDRLGMSNRVELALWYEKRNYECK